MIDFVIISKHVFIPKVLLHNQPLTTTFFIVTGLLLVIVFYFA